MKIKTTIQIKKTIQKRVLVVLVVLDVVAFATKLYQEIVIKVTLFVPIYCFLLLFVLF
jgi:hypothetical protein